MQILLISHLFPKVSDRRHGIFVLRQTEQLCAEGHHVVVISPVPYIPQIMTNIPRWRCYKNQTAPMDFNGLEVYSPAYIRPPGLWYVGYETKAKWLGIKSTVRRLALKRRFDLVYAQDFTSDVGVGCLAGRFLDIPCVGLAIGSDLNNVVHSSKTANKSIVGSLLACQTIIGNSRALCSCVDELTEGRREAICITRGTDLNRFYPVEKKKRKVIRAELGWADQEIIILCVGYIKREKGIFELLEAFEKIAGTHSSARLVFIGDGPLYNEFSNKVEHFQYCRQIEFRGHLDHDQIDRYYKASDLVVMPSYSEGMPNTVVESIASGLPILATRVGGIIEAAPDGIVGILVQPRDVHSLSEGLARLLSNEALRVTMGKAAREHAEKNFDINKNTKHLCELFDETVNRHKSISHIKSQLVDISSNAPNYMRDLAASLKAYPEVHCRVSKNRRDLDWYKGSGASEDLMAWVFRLVNLRPELCKNQKLWRVFRAVGYITAWGQVIGHGIRYSTKIIHIQWCMLETLDIVFFLLLRLLGFRVVYTAHNALPHGDIRWITKLKYKQLYRLSHAIVVLSENVGRDVRTLVLPELESKIHVIEHGLLLPRETIPSREEARLKLNLRIEDEVVLFFGGILPYKGINDLIDAIYLARSKRPGMKLLIAGNPIESFEPYKRQINDLGIAKMVQAFPEFVKETFKVTLYAAADICVLPYRKASQSGAALESLALGKPIIATNSGGLVDLIDHGKTGYLVPVQDPQAIAAALIDFFGRSRQEQQAIANASRRLGIERFNWKDIAAKHIALYKSLV